VLVTLVPYGLLFDCCTGRDVGPRKHDFTIFKVCGELICVNKTEPPFNRSQIPRLSSGIRSSSGRQVVTHLSPSSSHS
jgi:hypothetical protein